MGARTPITATRDLVVGVDIQRVGRLVGDLSIILWDLVVGVDCLVLLGARISIQNITSITAARDLVVGVDCLVLLGARTSITATRDLVVGVDCLVLSGARISIRNAREVPGFIV